MARHAIHRPCVELVVGSAGLLGFEPIVMQLSERLDLRAPDRQLRPLGRIIVGTECVQRRWAAVSKLPTVVFAHRSPRDRSWPWIELAIYAEAPMDDSEGRDLARRVTTLFATEPIDPSQRLAQRLAELGEHRGTQLQRAIGTLRHLSDGKDLP